MTFELPITGGCSCGDVRYVISAQPSMSFVCFCRECQMSGGTEGAPVVVVDRNAASISGSARKRTYRADNGSDMEAYFCGGCGSRMIGKPQRPMSPEKTRRFVVLPSVQSTITDAEPRM